MLKSTGIVRRIDDLGGIIIPKEVRRFMKIKEGDAFEIYTGECESITLKKWHATNGYKDEVKALIEYIAEETDMDCKQEVLVLLSQVKDILEKEKVGEEHEQ